jgi:hypothetical protein
MKKLLLLLCGLAVFQSGMAQFNENFDGVTLSNNTGSLPVGWVQYNVDNLTPYSSLSYMANNAWVVRGATATGTSNAATSISWYSPVGQSDDWMVTPQINIPTTNPVLSFKAMSPDQSFPDGFKVYVSTTGNTVADFTAAPLLTVDAAPETFTSYGIPLQTYSGQQVYIAFRNNSTDKFVLFIDDVSVQSLPSNNIFVTSANINRFVKTNTNNNITGTIQNLGGNTVTSVDMQWSDGTNNYNQQLNVNLAPFGTYDYSLNANPFNKSVVDEFNLSVTATQVNGNADSDPSDNSKTAIVSTVSTIKPKKVLVEEGTGTWCGWCPRGKVAMEYMYDTYPDFIGIMVHNGDPMTVADYDANIQVSGYPGCQVDRDLVNASVSQNLFIQYYDAYKNVTPPAEVSATAFLSGTTLEVNVTANFVTKTAGQFRLGAILVEDGIVGTGSGYDQTNYYAGGANGAMGGFESLNDPVPASQMVYDHVGRLLLGGYDGQQGSIPGPIVDGYNANYTFNIQFPSNVSYFSAKVVPVLIETATGRIWNSNMTEVKTYSSVEAINPEIAVQLFPNPASDIVTLSFNLTETADVNIQVYTMDGKIVSEKSLNRINGEQFIPLDVHSLVSGNYLISVSANGKSFIKTLTVK